MPRPAAPSAPALPEAVRAPTLWPVTAVVLSVLAVASVVNAFARAEALPCAFVDGVGYCQLANGELAAEPFNRRVAVPAVVSWMPGDVSVVDGFRIVSVAGSVLVVAGTYLLTRQLLRRVPEVEGRGVPLVAAALVAMSPHTFRLALGWPVMLDQIAAGLGTMWCLMVTARTPLLRRAAPLLALVLVLTREAWTLPLLVAAAVLGFVFHRTRQAWATVAVTVVATAFVITRPSAPSDYDTVRAFGRSVWRAVSRPGAELWFVWFGIGVVAVLVVLLLAMRHLLRDQLHAVVAVAAACHLAQSVVTGTDVGRLAFAALPFLLVLAVTCAARATSAGGWVAVALLGGATVALWQPFHVVLPPRDHEYVTFYYPGGFSNVVALVCLALAITGTWLVLKGLNYRWYTRT